MQPETPAGRSPQRVLWVLALLALVSVAAFMTLGVRGNWGFVLSFRGVKLAALVLVACAVAISTVLFQTISGNRILTPSVMGFDALYILLQTVLTFVFGAAAVSAADPRALFLVEVAAMVGFSFALYRVLFSASGRDLHVLVLTGLILGGLFRSLSGFLQRIIDPNDFVVLQDRLFASFNTVHGGLLALSALLVGLVVLVVCRILPAADVMLLGRDAAIALGVDHRRMTRLILILVTVLVSVSTALVGPVTFFGLLVANLAVLLVPGARHRHLLPAACLVAIICLVGGQTVLERLFAFSTALSIVIEFAGGLFFIFFLLKGGSR